MNDIEPKEQNHRELAKLYFSMGFQQKEIIDFLRVLHGKVISPRTLKRLLSQSKLFFYDSKFSYDLFAAGFKRVYAYLLGRWRHWISCYPSREMSLFVVNGHFLNAIKSVGGCPVTVRCDLGTENGTIEKLQNTLHELFNTVSTNRPPFLYGKSMHNQRIESWWAILRKHGTQYWMNVFQMLKDNNDFDGSFLDKSLIRFCFTPLIQEELDQISLEWNVHRIRKTRNAIAPAGKPAVMYEVPDLYGAREYLFPLPSFAIEILSSECTFIRTPCDKDFYDLCCMEMEENGLTRSSDPHQTIDLYLSLRNRMQFLFSQSESQ